MQPECSSDDWTGFCVLHIDVQRHAVAIATLKITHLPQIENLTYIPNTHLYLTVLPHTMCVGGPQITSLQHLHDKSLVLSRICHTYV